MPPLEEQTQPNQVWSIDFMSDSLTDGRRIRVFNVIDDYNREALMTKVGISFPAQRVTRLLNQLLEERGKPNYIRCDNGTEFTAKDFIGWADYNNVKIIFIQPGKPTQNAYVERFNKSFRRGVLDAYLFYTIPQAQEQADIWTHDYNYYHPHKSLGRKTPRELWEDFVNSGKLSEFTTINKDDNGDELKKMLNLELS
jgi:putative transposase